MSVQLVLLAVEVFAALAGYPNAECVRIQRKAPHLRRDEGLREVGRD